MSIKVFLDMDDTLYNLYGKENWLEKLENEEPGVFADDENFMPGFNYEKLCKVISDLMNIGVSFGVISWTPFAASPLYEEICRKEKLEWLAKNFPMIKDIAIIPYGIEKQKAITKKAQIMYLIDDNKEVCRTWETAKQRKAVCIDDDYSVYYALFDLYCDIVDGVI